MAEENRSLCQFNLLHVSRYKTGWLKSGNKLQGRGWSGGSGGLCEYSAFRAGEQALYGDSWDNQGKKWKEMLLFEGTCVISVYRKQKAEFGVWE